ncbi:hypothetical protein [endosymbiont GvMRE of Glomus versiforme]|uniref:hypothetical protein n=1 Tax=endosymbiont GvMRE of Glomus versiforme TaxID=2039283 RepID=UPI0011C3DE2B|nr:hypothetical protein [endosymbiont GvMRE of Glomus versiforme]
MLNPPTVKISFSGRHWDWRIEPYKFNYLHVTKRLVGKNSTENKTVNSTQLIIQNQETSRVLSEMFERERERIIVKLKFAEDKFSVENDEHNSINIKEVAQIIPMPIRDLKKIDSDSFALNGGIIDSIIQQIREEITDEVRGEISWWEQNIRARRDGINPGNFNDLELENYANKILAIIYCKKALLNARKIDENNNLKEIETALNDLREIERDSTGDTGLDEIKRWGDTVYRAGELVDEIERLNEIFYKNKNMTINLENHKGNNASVHIGHVLDDYANYLQHTISQATNQSVDNIDGNFVETAIEEWLTFALGNTGGRKDLTWLITNAGATLHADTDGGIPQDIRDMLTVLDNRNDLQDALKDLCDDKKLIENAKNVCKRTIQAIPNNQGERAVLENMVDTGAFNLADLYFLNKLIADLLGDAADIEVEFNRHMLGDPANALNPAVNDRPIERGGDTYGGVQNIYFWRRRWFVNLLSDKFKTIPINNDNIVRTLVFNGTATDPNCPFRHHLNVAWEEMALMIRILQERKVLEAELGDRGLVRGNDEMNQLLAAFGVSVVDNDGNFWNNFRNANEVNRTRLGNEKVRLAKTFKVNNWMAIGGTGDIDAHNANQDQAVVVGTSAADGLADDGTARQWRTGNETRPNAFRDYANILDNDVFNLTADPNAKRDYLQDIHKEIAIRRITMYLADNGTAREVVNAANLPQRQAADAAGGNTLALSTANDYRNYPVFIRGIARDDYNENNLNGFVVEITGKINTARSGLAIAGYRFTGNRIDANWGGAGPNLDAYTARNMNAETAALVYATYQAEGDVMQDGDATPGQITYNGNNYALRTPDGMRDYLEAKGIRENPLKNDGNEANRLWTHDGGGRSFRCRTSFIPSCSTGNSGYQRF